MNKELEWKDIEDPIRKLEKILSGEDTLPLCSITITEPDNQIVFFENGAVAHTQYIGQRSQKEDVCLFARWLLDYVRTKEGDIVMVSALNRIISCLSYRLQKGYPVHSRFNDAYQQVSEIMPNAILFTPDSIFHLSNRELGQAIRPLQSTLSGLVSGTVVITGVDAIVCAGKKAGLHEVFTYDGDYYSTLRAPLFKGFIEDLERADLYLMELKR